MAEGSERDRAEPLLLTTAQAAESLGVSEEWLERSSHIPRIDIAAPDSSRSMWRYRLSDLDAFLERRAKARRP